MTPAVRASRALAGAAGGLRFSAPVAFVYNPLVYAWEPHRAYLERWGRAPREVLLLGMNPGPFGMAQTGVPFGEVSAVRDWLGVAGPVGKPAAECPRRPVDGFSTRRSEVSGARLWGWAQGRFGRPEKFFERFFVLNYCPLAFMDAGGRNLTPDKLPAREKAALEAVCDEALRAMAGHFRPKLVVGVGKFAAEQALRALAGSGCRVGSILHPSPANPAANKGWAAAAERQLADLGLSF